MKLVGFLMLLAGWFLVLAAIVLFASLPLRAAFVLAGVAVEAIGIDPGFPIASDSARGKKIIPCPLRDSRKLRQLPASFLFFWFPSRRLGWL
jgi:hypothetical protein